MKVLNKEVIRFAKSASVVVVAIVATGLILDELGKGRLGDLPKKLAEKTTSGYGKG